MPEGLRERKAAQARLALKRSAFRLFKKKGFDATSVDEIADAADLSARTFFRYFASKEDVVFTQAEEDLAVIRGHVVAAPAGTPPFEVLEEAVVAYAAGLEGRREEMVVRFQLVAGSPVLQAKDRSQREAWAADLAAALGQRGGQGVSSDVHRLLAGMALSALSLGLQSWAEQDGAGNPADLIRVTLRSLHKEMA